MEFDEYDWDETKNLSNIAKHRVSFEEALQAVEDALMSDAVTEYTHKGELRFEAHGDGYGRPLVVFFTIRDRKARIISARRRA